MEESTTEHWVDPDLGFSDEEMVADIDQIVQPYVEMLARRRAEAVVARDIPRRVPPEYRKDDKTAARSAIHRLEVRLAQWERKFGLAPQEKLDDAEIRSRGAVIVWEDWFTELLGEIERWAIYTITLGQKGVGRGRRSVRRKGWMMVADRSNLTQSYERYARDVSRGPDPGIE